MLRGGFATAYPVGDAVGIDEHIRPDDLCARLTQRLHEVRVALCVHVLHDAKDALLGVDCPQCAVLADPELGKVIADKVRSNHSGGGLAAARGRRAGKVGLSPARPSEPGDEHMLREMRLAMVVGRQVDSKSMVALFQEERVASVGAKHRECRKPAPVHVDAGVGQVFWAVRPLTVHVREKHARPGHLGIELRVDVPVQQVGRVHHVGRRRDLEGRDRCRRADRAAAKETDEQRLALRDVPHVLSYILVCVVAQDALGQDTRVFVRIYDIEGAVDDARLFLRQVKVQRVIRHGNRHFFALGQALDPDAQQVVCRASVHKHVARIGHGNGVGDLEERFLIGDVGELGLRLCVAVGLEHCPGLVQRAHAADCCQDVDAFP